MRRQNAQATRRPCRVLSIGGAAGAALLLLLAQPVGVDAQTDWYWSSRPGGWQRPMGRMCPMGGAMPGVPMAPADLPEPTSAGAVTFKTYCTQCHALPSPKSHSAQHWQVALDRMLARMQMMEAKRGAPWGRWMPDVRAPNAQEAATLLAYLQRHALRALPEDQVPNATHPGARAFTETCSRCHALPDPAQRTPAEWPGIVQRMRENAKQMGAPPIEDASARKITEYLEQVGREPAG